MKSGMRETLLQEWEHTEKLIRNEFMKRLLDWKSQFGLKFGGLAFGSDLMIKTPILLVTGKVLFERRCNETIHSF